MEWLQKRLQTIYCALHRCDTLQLDKCVRGTEPLHCCESRHVSRDFSLDGDYESAGDRSATLNWMRSEIVQAVRLMQRGDDDALEQALALLQNTVFSFSMRVCGQRQDAEDTMQEVLLKSVPLLPKFDSPKALVVWLYKVAKTRCLMSRRGSKFAPNRELSLEELMPDRRELEKLSSESGINPERFANVAGSNPEIARAISHCPGVTGHGGSNRRRCCRDYRAARRNRSGSTGSGQQTAARLRFARFQTVVLFALGQGLLATGPVQRNAPQERKH